MRHRLVFTNLVLAALFFALAPTAMASNTWYVDGVNGSDSNNCVSSSTACKTIGHAISLASSGDSVMVAAATYIENLAIGFTLKIVGSGASTTIIDGGGAGTVVSIPNAGVRVILSRVTIRNGASLCTGAGISNFGTLTVNNSTISGNVQAYPLRCEGIGGGGISNFGTLTVNNSTISGNTAANPYEARGGGIASSSLATLTISNSTISGNTAVYNGYCQTGCVALGGGIYSPGTGTISNSTISNSTISGNITAGNGRCLKYCFVQGSGIYNRSIATAIQNSVVADNIGAGGNCYGTIASKGYNLSSDGTCNFSNTGDLNNTDPKLGTLGNYGGPTQTIPLLSGSPAIDAGNPSGCTDSNGILLKNDQRGFPRPDKEDTGGCDMGAYEQQKD